MVLGIHGLLGEWVSSDTPFYLLDPEVLLSGFLVILNEELGSFGMVSSESTQEKAWNDGWRHLLDSEIGRKIQKPS